jgi:hypothetical protein
MTSKHVVLTLLVAWAALAGCALAVTSSGGHAGADGGGVAAPRRRVLEAAAAATVFPAPDGAKGDSASLCRLAPDAGPCRAALPRFFWNAAAGRCSDFVYGGCGGNANNFADAQACEAACKMGQPLDVRVLPPATVAPAAAAAGDRQGSAAPKAPSNAASGRATGAALAAAAAAGAAALLLALQA